MSLAVKREAVNKVVILKSKDGSDLTKWIADEIRNEIARVALDEVQDQIQDGNEPNIVKTNITPVDELSKGDIAFLKSANRNTDIIFGGQANKITWYFADLQVLFDAIAYAYGSLKRRMRRKSGAGFNTVYFWCSTGGAGYRASTLSQVESYLKIKGDASTSVHMLGPTLEYRRFLTYGGKGKKWLTPGKSLSPGYATDRYKFNPTKKGSKIGRGFLANGRGPIVRVSGPRSHVQVSRAIHEDVKNNVSRNYRAVVATYGFTPSAEMPLPIRSNWRPDGNNQHIPVIRFYLRSR